MPTIEERVAYLEGQVSEQSHALLEVRDAVRHLEQRMETRFDTFEQRMDAKYSSLEQRMDAKHSSLEQRMDARLDAFEQRVDVRFAGVDRRIGGLEDKMSRQFVWTVGVQVTTFVAIVAALLSRA